MYYCVESIINNESTIGKRVKARKIIKKYNSVEIKKILLNHVKNCKNQNCMTCNKLRERIKNMCPVEKATNSNEECSICKVNKKFFTYVNCGHCCLCNHCKFSAPTKCPICRTENTKPLLKIYY